MTLRRRPAPAGKIFETHTSAVVMNRAITIVYESYLLRTVWGYRVAQVRASVGVFAEDGVAQLGAW